MAKAKKKSRKTSRKTARKPARKPARKAAKKKSRKVSRKTARKPARKAAPSKKALESKIAALERKLSNLSKLVYFPHLISNVACIWEKGSR